MHDVPDGEYVLFSDLPALIEKVREDERRKAPDNGAYTTGRLLGYVQGQRDEREACIAAVEEAACHDAHKGYYVSKLTVERVVAAIRAREEKP